MIIQSIIANNKNIKQLVKEGIKNNGNKVDLNYINTFKVTGMSEG